MARKRKQGTVKHINHPTARVRVDEMRRHPLYGKQYRTSVSLLTHVPAELTLNLGDTVVIEEIRPISKRKAWQVVAVTKQAELLEAIATEEQV
ncbi:MAG: uS17 family ribosomal protein [Patescibacteria group bacterium]